MDVLNIMTILMIFISLIMFTIYYINYIKYEAPGYKNPYIDKAWICLFYITFLIFIKSTVKNSIVDILILVVGIIILTWTVFTKVFDKKAEKNELYDELIYAMNQEDLTDFKKHMSREEQITFLKNIKTTIEYNEKEETIDKNGNKVVTTKTTYEEVPLIENDDELKEFEPILRKKDYIK